MEKLMLFPVSLYLLITRVTCQCGAGGLTYNRHCIYYVNKTLNWIDANNYCRNVYDTDLIIIHDAAINTFVIGNIPPSVPNWWINLNDQNTETLFMWRVDGIEVSANFTNWDSGEPNDLFGEDCGALDINRTDKWNDLNCGREIPFICAACQPYWQGITCQHETRWVISGADVKESLYSFVGHNVSTSPFKERICRQFHKSSNDLFKELS